MWIAGLRLRVATKNHPGAGTDRLVTATILRDGKPIHRVKLDHANEDDLEPGAIRDYDFSGPTALPRIHDGTPDRPSRHESAPYPPFGLEFSEGLQGHLQMKLQVHGEDVWVKDSVELLTKEFRQVQLGPSSTGWVEDRQWTYVAKWAQDVPISAGEKGQTAWTLQLG